jgi:hypothetical protein
MNRVRMVCICTAMWNISQYTVRKWHCCVYSIVSITKEWVLYHKTPAYTPQLPNTLPKDELFLKLAYWRIKIKLPVWMVFLLNNPCHDWYKYYLLYHKQPTIVKGFLRDPWPLSQKLTSAQHLVGLNPHIHNLSHYRSPNLQDSLVPFLPPEYLFARNRIRYHNLFPLWLNGFSVTRFQDFKALKIHVVVFTHPPDYKAFNNPEYEHTFLGWWYDRISANQKAKLTLRGPRVVKREQM